MLVINDEEARQLAAEHNLVKAAAKIREMGPRTLVIKRGEYGVLVSARASASPRSRYPLETVVDPTGAGDSFAGGFMGYLATHPEVTTGWCARRSSSGASSARSASRIWAPGVLQTLTRDEVFERYQEFKELTDFAEM